MPVDGNGGGGGGGGGGGVLELRPAVRAGDWGLLSEKPEPELQESRRKPVRTGKRWRRGDKQIICRCGQHVKSRLNEIQLQCGLGCLSGSARWLRPSYWSHEDLQFTTTAFHTTPSSLDSSANTTSTEKSLQRCSLLKP